MPQHLTLTCQTVQGKPATMILELNDPVDYTSDGFGSLTVLLGQEAFYSLFLRTHLNRQIVWDTQYLQSLRNIFKNTHKQYTVSLTPSQTSVLLEIKSQITKGIKIILMRCSLSKDELDSCAVLESLFERVFAEKTNEREQMTNELRKIEEKNELIEREIKRVEVRWQEEQLRTKNNFLKELNEVKLRIRRKWPDLTRSSLHEEKMESEDAPQIRVIQPMEELFNVFK